MSGALPEGKLDSEILKKIVFENIHYRRPEVRKRPGIGEDCAVVDFGGYDCVMSTDPITAAVSDIGRLSIHISCNDIASNGVQPVGIFLAVMLPLGTTEEDISHIMKQAADAAAAVNVEIIGGHTEITHAVNQPVIVSTAVGRSPAGFSASAEDMREGDVILMTKKAGIEGTGVIASDYGKELSKILSQQEISEARAMLDSVSVVKEGVAAGNVGTAGMHDITEGGLLGAVWELCQISGLGALVEKDKVPVSDLTKKICDYFGINPLRLISSGCMLIMVHPENEDAVKNAVTAEGVEISRIGVITGKKDGILLKSGSTTEEILPPAADELYRVAGHFEPSL
ncbi:MAG: AIR synthase family protein [Clostridia bacterium]|nr:AIR synthase family protein [Clostridia bacterium]